MSLSNSHFPGLNILGGDYCRQNDVCVCGSQSNTAPRWRVGGDKKKRLSYDTGFCSGRDQQAMTGEAIVFFRKKAL